MQPLQDDLWSRAAKDNSMTNAATVRRNLDAAITMRSAETELQNTIELRATASEIVAPTPEQKKLILNRKWKQPKSERSFFFVNRQLHRQLLHQHHLQSHLQWGNDPTVANHNGIPSATHPPAPLAIPFTLRERSYSCKSQWNSVDRKCTKHRWHPIYNAEPIRDRSDHDPSMIRPHTRPSRTRRTAEVDHRRSGTHFVWKNIGFRASAISQKHSKTHFVRDFLRKLHRQLLHQHHLQSHLQWGNDPRVANHNGIPSATHPPAPLAIPFTLRERSYSCKSQWNSVDRRCTKHRWHPIYNAEPIRDRSDHDPRPFRPHTRPSRTRRTAVVDHRRSGTDFVWKNIGFRASAISQKRISCETSSKTPSATPPPAPLAIPFTVREQFLC